MPAREASITGRSAGGGLSSWTSQLVSNSVLTRFGVARHEDLRNRAAAVAPHEMHRRNTERVEKRGEHAGLVLGRDTLTFGDLRVPKAHGVRRDATSIRRKTLQRTAPLKAIERKSVHEQSGRSRSAFHVSCSALEQCRCDDVARRSFAGAPRQPCTVCLAQTRTTSTRTHNCTCACC